MSVSTGRKLKLTPTAKEISQYHNVSLSAKIVVTTSLAKSNQQPINWENTPSKKFSNAIFMVAIQNTKKDLCLRVT